jgi:hypothetical protein
MSKEALKLALAALEGVLDDAPKVLDASISGGLYEVVQCRDAITTIKATLEAKDEPKCVAIVEVFGKDWRLDYMALPVGKHKLYAQQYTYTTPPQRTWVGLTDEEVKNIVWNLPYEPSQEHIRAIEAKLKEKNT